MKRTNHLERMLLNILFAFVALSLRAQSADDSTFSLSPGDITEATIGTSGGARLQVTLTPEKRAEFSAFTARNVNKQVKIVIGGKLRWEPFIREQIAGPSMEIFVKSPEDAVATVKALLTSRVTFEHLHKWKDSGGQTHYSEKPPSHSSDPPPDAKPRDNNTFQELRGSWGVLQATMNGKESRDASLLEGNWTFQNSGLIMESPQKGKVRFALKIDAKAQPKAFHLTSVEPANEASGWMLFSREGEKLKIALYDNLEGRPESFEPRGPRSKPELIVLTLSPRK